MPNKSLSIRQSFGDTLVKLARSNPQIYVVSADLKSSVKLSEFARKFPKRFIECGVAENNAAGVAAGLAHTGKTVFLASYSCFSPAINWATIKQSISYNHSNVKIIGSHSGLLSTALGSTHQMLEDIALMRSLPNMQVFSPADAYDTQKIIPTIAASPLPAYVRLVRANTPLFTDPRTKFTIGIATILQEGKDITVIGHGPVLHQALTLQSSVSIEVINCPSIKPLDNETILKSVKKTGRLIVIEDHQKNGGLGEAIATMILESGLSPKFIHLAIDNRFGQSGHDPNQLYEHYGISSKNLLDAINKLSND